MHLGPSSVKKKKSEDGCKTETGHAALQKLTICSQQRFCTFASPFNTRSHRGFVQIVVIEDKYQPSVLCGALQPPGHIRIFIHFSYSIQVCWDGAASHSSTGWGTAGLGAALEKRTQDPGEPQGNLSHSSPFPTSSRAAARLKPAG